MSDYTPTTEQVRDGYRYDTEAEYRDPITPHHEINGRAFDRWLKAHDAQVAAQALRDAADALDAYQGDVPDDPRWTCDLGYYGEAEWLRDRANQITKENR